VDGQAGPLGQELVQPSGASKSNFSRRSSRVSGKGVNTGAPEFNPTVLWDRNELYFVRVRETTDFFTTPLQLP